MAEHKRHQGHRQRMRERVQNYGLDSLADHEVLEYILYTTNAQRDTNDIAYNLLERFGDFASVLEASEEELCTVEGVGPASARLLHMLPQEFRSVYAPVLRPDAETEQLVKAADKLSAYIKCVEELKAGNNEFREAAAQTRTALESYGLPEVAYFLETFLPSFSLTLDELK